MIDFGFWKDSGGRVLDADLFDQNKLLRSVITLVAIRDQIYTLVQQTAA